MAIEQRHGKEYFYRKKRIGGKVVSEYVAGGEFGLFLEDWEQLIRQETQNEKNKLEAERYEFETIDYKLDDMEADIDNLLTAYLNGQGFYKTSSREWRYKQDD